MSMTACFRERCHQNVLRTYKMSMITTKRDCEARARCFAVMIFKPTGCIVPMPRMTWLATLLVLLPPCPLQTTFLPLQLSLWGMQSRSSPHPQPPYILPVDLTIPLQKGGLLLGGLILRLSIFRSSTSSTSSVVVGSSPGPTSWLISSLLKRQKMETLLISDLSALSDSK